MRRFVVPVIAALAAVLAAESQARAGHCCGATSAPAPCATDCCYPKVRYKTQYQTVVEHKQVMKCKTVTECIMKECRQIVCKPVYETKEVEQKQIICKPVQEKSTREVLEQVTKQVQVQHMRECRQVVCKPVYEEKQVKVCTGEWKTEQYCAPGRTHHKLVRDEGCCYVDPCTGCTHQSRGRLSLVTCQGAPELKCRKVWCPREECRTVRTCRMVPETVVTQVPYTVCRTETGAYVDDKGVGHPTEVPGSKWVPGAQIKRQVEITTCKMVQEEVIKKVPVTTCRMVQEEVVKQVPVTVCKKVPVCETVKVCKRVKVCVPVVECDRPSLCDRLRSHFQRDDCCNGHNGGCNGHGGHGGHGH